LNLKCDTLLSSFALNFKLRRYTAGELACVGSPLFLKTRFGVGYHLTLVLSDQGTDGGGSTPASAAAAAASVSAISRLVLGGIKAGGVLITSTRPTFNLLLLLCASVRALTLKVSHAPISVECLFS